MNNFLNHYLKTLCVSASILLAGCAGRYEHALRFNPREPLRVAILPFYQVSEGRHVTATDTNTLLDDIPLLSVRLEESPAEYVKDAVETALDSSGLDLVPTGYVNTQLSHHGYRNKGVTDFQKLLKVSPKALCEILLCDVLLYGKVTEWDRSYYAIQSVTTVGVELMMIRANDGKVVYNAIGHDQTSRGITKIPTGLSSIVIEPILGLDNEIIKDLARNVSEKLVAPLSLKTRPEALKTAAPTILASSHDAVSGTISRNEPLTVVMLGSAGKNASFSIGKVIVDIPMNELDPGHYIGDFYPLSSDTFKGEQVTVRLGDDVGRISEQRVGVSTVTLSASR